MIPPLLTSRELSSLQHTPNGAIALSLDLGKSISKVEVKNGVAHFPNGESFPLDTIKRIKEETIYFVEQGQLKQAALFSDETNFYYKLIPTSDWPTITLSSTPMHRHTRMSPKEDAQSRIREISPIKGIALDTCCGLGYTAILLSREAEKVHTFDIDPNVQRVAEFNPYSEELFTRKNITLTYEDIAVAIKKFPNRFFDRIIHDPPTLKYSPELYSREFHSELFRVLKVGGILHHYCPTPKKTHGELLYPRIERQLREAGFKQVKFHPQSSGIRAVK